MTNKNILIITETIDAVNGVSNHIINILTELNKKNYKFLVFCGGGDNLRALDDIGCKVIIYERLLHDNRSYCNFFSSMLKIREIIKNNQIKIVHSHNHYAANLAHYASLFSKTKTLQTNHGIIPETGKLKHFRADFHIALNNRTRNYLIEYGKINDDKVFLIRPGCNREFAFTFKKPHSTVQIFCASRLIKEKGIYTYIRAANSLQREHPGSYLFYLSGTGADYNDLFKFNESLGGAVKFVDPLKGFEEIFSGSHIFVFPSESDMEGVPMVILEAISKGCLVITSEYPGVEEIFSDDYNDLIFKPGDFAGLQNIIKYASENYEKLVSYKASQYIEISKTYSFTDMINKHDEIYGFILNSD